MSDEQPSGESGPQLLRDSLDEIRQSLDALADRVQRLEAAPGGSPPTPGITPPDSPEERDALSAGQEILAIPSSGLDPAQVFSLAMDRVARLLSADRAMLFVWEPDGSRLVARAGRGFRRSEEHTSELQS